MVIDKVVAVRKKMDYLAVSQNASVIKVLAKFAEKGTYMKRLNG